MSATITARDQHAALSPGAESLLGALTFFGLVALVGGAMLWYARDVVDQRFVNWEPTQWSRLADESVIAGLDGANPWIQVPWWRAELGPGERLVLAVDVPDPAPAGRWFVRLLGRAAGDSGGRLRVEGGAVAVAAARYPRWHHVDLPDALKPGTARVGVAYEPDTAGGTFEVWGQYFFRRNEAGPVPFAHTPRLERDGQVVTFDEMRPVPFRGRRGTYEADEVKETAFWGTLPAQSHIDAFWQAGVRQGSLSLDVLGIAMMWFGGALLAALAAARAWTFVRRYPLECAGLAVICVATFWLRWHALGLAVESLAVDAYGTRIENGLWYDSATYMLIAMQILANLTPADYGWSAGFPLAAALTFSAAGLDPLPVKFLHALVQAAIGVAIYVIAWRATRAPRWALAPALAWTFVSESMPYTYFFLTETLAMLALTVCVAMLLRARTTSACWWSLACAALVFATGAYVRDVLIVLLPPVLLSVIAIFGPTVRRRAAGVALFLAIVAGVWAPTSAYHANKGESLNTFALLPMNTDHFYRAKRSAADEKDRGMSLGFLVRAAEKYLGGLTDDPVGFASDKGAASYRFWAASWGDAVRLIMSESAFVAYRDGVYRLIWFAVIVGMAWALVSSVEARHLALLFVYVTAFHVFLYPDFTARPKAIYLPLLAVLGYLCAFHCASDLWRRAAPWLARRDLAQSLPGASWVRRVRPSNG